MRRNIYARSDGQPSERALERSPAERVTNCCQACDQVLVHPYVIFFHVAASSVEIVRVLHQRRDLESIFADDVDG